mmetsp:Transcript_36893/g.86196  ORF Transcript_36893/g.86196 Transcript_36893/m.86196 type:complete len:268 (+) Transcript_36893:322-1125(+)
MSWPSWLGPARTRAKRAGAFESFASARSRGPTLCNNGQHNGEGGCALEAESKAAQTGCKRGVENDERKCDDRPRCRHLAGGQAWQGYIKEGLEHFVVVGLHGVREHVGERVRERVLRVGREHHIGEVLVACRRDDGFSGSVGCEDGAARREGIDHTAQPAVDDGVNGGTIGEESSDMRVARGRELAIEAEHVVGGERERAARVGDGEHARDAAVVERVLVDDDAGESVLSGEHHVAGREHRHGHTRCTWPSLAGGGPKEALAEGNCR